jgi:hypothetical protein
VVLGVFAAPFLKLWLGRHQPEILANLPALVMALRLALIILVLRLGITTSWNVFQASGTVREPALTAVVEGLINQALSLLMILGFSMGLPAIYLGSLLAQLLRIALVHPRQLKVAIGGSAWDNAWQSLAAPLSGALALTALCTALKFTTSSMPATLGGLLAIGVVYAGWMWVVLLDSTERKAFKGAVTRVRAKRHA